MTIETFGAGAFNFDANRNPVVDAHMLPFSIKYDGEAPIRQYFHPCSKENNLKSASFRGRELTGQTVSLPETSLGLKMDVDRLGIHWKVVERFNEITFWSPDDSLHPDQHIRESLPLWLRISKSVHDPVSAKSS